MSSRTSSFLLPALVMLTASALVAAEPVPAQDRLDFAETIAPVFREHCLRCHEPGQAEGELSLASADGLRKLGYIVPGRPEESYLLDVISGSKPAMPKDGQPLDAAEVALIRRWIAEGATWPDGLTIRERGQDGETWWSLQPLREVTVPRAGLAGGAFRNPIDCFIAARLHEHDLSLSPEASRRILIRRVYLDMLGLMPSPERVRQFEQDRRPDAYERLIDELLASPHYGERWARHWLDVVRFAESNGFETNHERPTAYHYRDWVVAALNEDKPYNDFVFAQIAGDARGENAATGFLVGGPYDTVKSPDPALTAMQRQDELADIINTTGTAFLGLTLGCARCHNHKFDPVTQRDYYAVAAVFAGVHHGERPLQIEPSPENQRRGEELAEQIAVIDRQLQQHLGSEPFTGQTLVIDDETPIGDGPAGSGAMLLAEKRGHGQNPPGTERGYRDDPGGANHTGNISGGRYTWWDNTPGRDVFAYAPNADGPYRVWLSWGCGWDTHSRDAHYLLDRDGDPATRGDQTEIAAIDQQRFADGTGEIPRRPLWSGFYDAGIHEFAPTSRILIRSGQSGTAVTADVIVLRRDDNRQPSAKEPGRLMPRPAVNARVNEEHFEPITVRFVRFTALATSGDLEPCLDELEVWSAGGEPANVARADGVQLSSSGNYQGNPKHKLEHLNDGRYGNSHSWIADTRGRGWVQLELPDPVTVDRIVWGRDRERQYTDRLAFGYRIEVASKPEEWRTVADSTDRLPSGSPQSLRLAGLSPERAAQVEKLTKDKQQLETERARLLSPPTAYIGRFREPGPTHRLYRGDPLSPREPVAPDTISILGSLGLQTDAAEPSRRIALAEWLTSPEHPLTARVMVNRIWQHHFGRGLVATPSDFGRMGAKPSHPELLDWLAGEFTRGGWSIKQMHRLILHSATYRQSSRPRPDALRADAQTTLLWRFPPRRLSAEAIRDNILLAAGSLDRRLGGPGFLMFHPNSNYARNWIARDDFGPPEFRRMIYALDLRMEHDAVFGAFDCPDGGQPAPNRSRSTTPIQSLNLLNSPFVLDQAERLADRVRQEMGGDVGRQVNWVFELVFQRVPTAEERSDAQSFVDAHGLPALCRAVLNANEFLFLR